VRRSSKNFPQQKLSTILSPNQKSRDAIPSGLAPEDITYYTYAVWHSPTYRTRYAEFLKIDFPRLPLTGNLELFRALAHLGGELVALHLLESPTLDKPITEFIGGQNPEVGRVDWSAGTVWLDAPAAKSRRAARAGTPQCKPHTPCAENDGTRRVPVTMPGTIGFKGVREDVWNFHIGGYQVCEKWLKDRKGRTLTKDDIAHYHKIVVALSETIRLMVEIDKVIDKHGGWPGAFTTEPVAETDGKPPQKDPFA
jgi:hypothetical protein